jgi:molecular chaperone DnaK (HSP70)
LWLDAEEVKHTLSERTKATLVCFHAGIRMRLEITRDQFENLTNDLVERTETTTSLVVKQAGLDWSQIDRVLLVGGSSRMPMIRTLLRNITGKEPDCSQSPDEAVAHGAALYAGMLMGQKVTTNKSACELINVNSHSLGVVGLHPHTKQRINVVLIPKNTALPCRAMRTFKTAQADQRSVKVGVVEGESDRPEACIALGECVVRNLPLGLPRNTPVEVEYTYHANGRLSVAARVPSVRYSQHVEIQRETNRNLGDLNLWQSQLCGRLPQTAVVIPSTNEQDSSNTLKQLDSLYQTVGKLAVNAKLPESLLKSRQLAASAAIECTRSQTNLNEIEHSRQAMHGKEDAIRLDAQLAQAKMELHQAKVRADFAYLVLGRDCAFAGFKLPEAEKILAEIHRLQD